MGVRVVIRGPSEDKDALESIARASDDPVIQEIERFEGLSSMIELSISLTPAVVAIVRTYLTEASKRDVARELVIDCKTFRFKGYNVEEIDRILKVASGISGEPRSDCHSSQDDQNS